MEITVLNSENVEFKLYVMSKNSKLGNIDNFSVKKGIEAYCNKNCNKCYCNYMKMFSEHVMQVESNFNAIDESKNDLILYCNIVDAISSYIKSNGCNVFRFNVEGDINNNYLSIIMKVAKNCSNCAIYLYTKNYDVVEQQLHNIVTIDNLTILLSIMSFNDSYIIEKFKKYDNIKFFITTRDEQERLLYYKTYHFYFKSCKYDNDSNIKCNGCKLCFNNESQFIFNDYRGIKKVKKNTIHCVNIFLNTLTRFESNNFLNTALKEALTAIFCNTTSSKKELANLDRLVGIKIRSFSKNSKKNYGQCEKINNDYYKITINNMNYYKTVCVLIHELLHVLAFKDGHRGRFDKYAKEIEENTVYVCRGAKIKLNDINYKNCLELENEVKEMSQYFVKTRILTNFSCFDFAKTTKNELIARATNYYCTDKNNDYKYVNVRSLAMKSIREYINNKYIDIAKNND